MHVYVSLSDAVTSENQVSSGLFQTQTEKTKRTGSSFSSLSLPSPLLSSRRKSKSTSLRGTCWRFQVPSGALSPLAQQPRRVIKRLPPCSRSARGEQLALWPPALLKSTQMTNTEAKEVGGYPVAAGSPARRLGHRSLPAGEQLQRDTSCSWSCVPR